MKKPWEIEDWHKAEGVVAKPNQTNSALAKRDYSVPCRAPSENLIQVVAGYWIWWCSAHHQPRAHCERARLQMTVDFLLETVKEGTEITQLLSTMTRLLLTTEVSRDASGMTEIEATLGRLETLAKSRLGRTAKEGTELLSALRETPKGG
jgi:hypothetical protein